jgi:disulfide bond formation protein DsbB
MDADAGEAAGLRLARAIALAAPLLLLAGAYIGQYAFGLFPCEMCWWQRYAHVAALALAVLALFVRGPAVVALAAVAIALSGVIGAYHAGVEYQWWEGLTACTSTVTEGGDPLDAIMNAPLVRCDVPQWSLFGVSLAGWNFLFSGAAATAIAFLLARGPRTSR